jgi:hypothetical protein
MPAKEVILLERLFSESRGDSVVHFRDALIGLCLIGIALTTKDHGIGCVGGMFA